MVEKTRAGGQWTEARYKSFIRSALRSAWMRWPPNHNTKKQAKIRYGVYQCAGYKVKPHEAKASVVIDGKRKNNVFTDHIKPVAGNGDFNTIIANLFCETDNLQVLCKSCHDIKTKDERAAAREAKKSEINEN